MIPRDTFQTTSQGGKTRQSMKSLIQLKRTEIGVQSLRWLDFMGQSTRNERVIKRTPVISVHRDRTIDTNYTETLMGKKVNKNSVTCGKILKSQTYI